MSLKQFAAGIMENNQYTPDLPEIMQQDFHYLFTYGSLKSGFCRNHTLRGCDVVATGFTMDDEYIMYRTTTGQNPFPIIFPHIGPARGTVYGEVVRIPSSLVPYLDFMEGNGNLYQRELVPIAAKVRGKDIYENVNCWMYTGIAKSWEKYMNHKEITLCERQSAKFNSGADYFIYMRKYEKEAQEATDKRAA